MIFVRGTNFARPPPVIRRENVYEYDNFRRGKFGIKYFSDFVPSLNNKYPAARSTDNTPAERKNVILFRPSVSYVPTPVSGATYPAETRIRVIRGTFAAPRRYKFIFIYTIYIYRSRSFHSWPSRPVNGYLLFERSSLLLLGRALRVFRARDQARDETYKSRDSTAAHARPPPTTEAP